MQKVLHTGHRADSWQINIGEAFKMATRLIINMGYPAKDACIDGRVLKYFNYHSDERPPLGWNGFSVRWQESQEQDTF